MSINAKTFTLSRVNPDRASAPAAPSNTVADDWQFLCGGEATQVQIQNNHNTRRKLTDCQDRDSDVVTESTFTGREVTLNISGTVENTAAGRWLVSAAMAGTPVIADGRLYLPGIYYIRTDWQITSFENNGADLDGNVTFSATLQSSGPVTYTEIALP